MKITHKPVSHWQDGKSNHPKYDLAIVIGRFQPLHRAHEKLLHIAQEYADCILVIVGSANKARDIKNPFTVGERREMVLRTIGHLNARFRTEGVTDDLYSDQRWLAEVQSHVDSYLLTMGLTQKNAKICIVGHHKDESSYYLDKFPKFDLIEVDSVNHPDGTEIRESLFRNNHIPDLALPTGVENFIRQWVVTYPQIYADLRAEYSFLEDYKKPYAGLPYKPIFQTTDCVVICNGHVLLVKRRGYPGKGLYALPGGFLNADERIKDGAIRELKEETKIKVSENLLRASIRGNHRFDAPGRSLRGRTITDAFLIVLDLPELPQVKGSDDAEHALWMPLSEFYKQPEKMFEDHYSVISYFVGRV